MGLVGLLVACAIAWLAFAAYLGLTQVLEPVWAAMATGGGCLVFALVVYWIFAVVSRPKAPQSSPGLEALMQQAADPLVRDLIVRHPDRASLAALALGVAAGSSQTARSGILTIVESVLASEVDPEEQRRS
ncbi:hypothetical protein GCM10007392_27910 [Saccharospirillum salsuginis]|uniref:Uncharacterized protein n=1 Tax=Saccharospirillum salsuginis TaxID=418750 RepID=A0A918KDW9_9GAMM|nr:hypothetical protein GCM10007392_27910 [Saccharospirillum salsuginis]